MSNVHASFADEIRAFYYRNVPKGFHATFSNSISSCLFFTRFCYDYVMAILETNVIILLGHYYESDSLFLAMASSISIAAGIMSIFLSLITPYIKDKLGDNSFFGYVTPIAFIILSSAFFACIFTGHGIYACYVGIALQAIIRPFRYTFFGSFTNSAVVSGGAEVQSTQGFINTFGSRPSKWLAALMMMFFVISASFSGSMAVLAFSVAMASLVWLASIYYTPKTEFTKKEHKPVYGRKFWYWSVISTLAIVSTTLLHILKDLVSAKLIGATLLPTIRVVTAVPAVMAFYAIGSAIKNCYLEKNSYFNVTLLAFGAVFILFACLFPYGAALQSFAVPSFLPGFAAMMLQNWFFIAFTLFCEMWPVIVTGNVIYPMQNEIFDEEEIFSVVPKITIMQSLGEFMAGVSMRMVSAYQLPVNTVIMVVAVLVLGCILTMVGCHHAMTSGGLKPKYLFQEQMKNMFQLRHEYRNKFIKIFSAALFFGLGIFALSSGFSLAAGGLMLSAATIFMSDQLITVKQQFSGFGHALPAEDFKPSPGDAPGVTKLEKDGKAAPSPVPAAMV